MQLRTQQFMWLLRAGVLTYARSFDHPGCVYVVRAGSGNIEVSPVSPLFMPASLKALSDKGAPERWESERYEDIRRLRIAQALERIAQAGALNAHTTLWLHARLNELTARPVA